MLTVNYPSVPNSILLLQVAFAKNIKRVKNIDLCQKALSFLDFEVPNEFHSLFQSCFDSWVDLASAAECIKNESSFNYGTPVQQQALLACHLAFKKLGNTLAKALQFEVMNVDKIRRDLEEARVNLQNLQELAVKALNTRDEPPVNGNLLYVSDRVAFENKQIQKQQDAQNASKEQARLEKEREDRERASTETLEAKDKALQQQKQELQKRLQSNQAARERTTALCVHDKRQQVFAPSFDSTKNDLDTQLFDIVLAQAKETHSKFSHKSSEINAAMLMLNEQMRGFMKDRDSSTSATHRDWIINEYLKADKIKSLATYRIGFAALEENERQEREMRITESLRKKDEEKARKEQREAMPMMR